MTLAATEAFGSESYTSGRDRTAELRYIVTGATATTTSLAVSSLIGTTAPASFNGMASRSIKVEPLGETLWQATVTYRPSELLPEAESTYVGITFNTAGSSETVQTALLQTTTSLMRETDGTTVVTAMNPGLNVNIDEDMNVNGIEITVPKFEFSETHYIANSSIRDASGNTVNSYINTLHNATGKTNNQTFRGFAVGTVLFLGASGTKRPAEGDWEITFSFLARPDASLSLPLFKRDGSPVLDGNGVQQTVSYSKPGHDYLWFHRQRQLDSDGLETVLDRSVNLARVYDRTAFTFVPNIT